MNRILTLAAALLAAGTLTLQSAQAAVTMSTTA